MKKLYLLISLILIVLSVCSCTTVSKDKYNKLFESNTKLETEIKSLKNNILDKETESLTKELPLQYADAWVSTAFGESAGCAIIGDYLYILVHTNYVIDAESVSKIMDEYISSLKLYKATYNITPDSLPFKTVSVTFLDTNDNDIIKYTIDNSEGDFLTKDTLINMTNIEPIADGLSK